MMATTAIVLCSPVSATDWTITPRVDLREGFTDNLTLAPRGAERSSFITEVSPGIHISGVGPEFKANLSYSMQNLYYSDNDERLQTNHLLSSNVRARIAGDLHFDGKAAIAQQNISPFSPQALDNLNAPSNRTEVRSYSASPYLEHRFADTAIAELRYTHDAVRTRDRQLLDSDADHVFIKIDSGPAFNTFGWRALAEEQRIDDDRRGRARLQRVSAAVAYRLSRQWALLANVGDERYTYFAPDDGPEGRFWSVGVEWKPSDRSKVAARAGHRFYGRTYVLNVAHRAGNMTIRANYDEEISMSRAQFLLPAAIDSVAFLNDLWEANIPDPAARKEAIDRFIRNTGTPDALAEPLNALATDFYLEKKARVSLAFAGERSTTILAAFHARRDADVGRTARPGGASLAAGEGHLRQAGASARWLYRMAERTTLVATAEYARVRSLSTSREDRHKLARVALLRTLRPNVDASVELRRNMQTSSSRGDGMTENAIVAGIRIEF